MAAPPSGKVTAAGWARVSARVATAAVLFSSGVPPAAGVAPLGAGPLRGRAGAPFLPAGSPHGARARPSGHRPSRRLGGPGGGGRPWALCAALRGAGGRGRRVGLGPCPGLRGEPAPVEEEAALRR